MENESEIIKSVLESKKDAYEVIVKKYMKKAYFIALGFVENQQDAMDLSQDAFIKAYRSLTKFDTTKEFFPETILLRYFQGFSYSEISDILDCPIGTVMSRLYYAKKKLCKKLEGVLK